ncbi:hypothetical protein HBE96_09120 [Clostridium sp. P21]|uniref:LXG domain-containing protein n=1 Tax=Clostridium muellerianum TaxID=2716538 RepID=A0A7Y0EG95_9CLOT|nr:hypothetical protein [Clostridium muellerianum]NMM62858.1 hypothetical protein [Clostridium muellerianum]
MSKLAIKYAGCQDTVDNLKNISCVKYEDLINNLTYVLNSLNKLTYKPDTSRISNSINKAKENQKKLMNFANGLESYARELYAFDNTFYNNFVLLDGTNLKSYKNNIGTMEISDEEIEKIFFSDKNSLERYLYLLSKALRNDLSSKDNSLINAIGKEMFKFSIDPGKMKALKFLLGGNSFEIIENGEKIFIKLKNSKLNPNDLGKCAKYFHDEFKMLRDKELKRILTGRSSKNINKLKDYVDKLINKGVEIYDGESEKWTKDANKILKGRYDDLNKYIKMANLEDEERIFTNAKDGAIEDLLGEVKYIKSGQVIKDVKNIKIPVKHIKDIKISSGVNLFGKAFGVYDKGKTIYNNANDDLKDENGKWTLANGEKTKKFVVDTTVDLGSSAGAVAAGAAIGSIVPGAGTVVGAAAGATINVLINYKYGEPPESTVDKTKKLANKAVDKIGSYIGKVFQ